MATTGEDSLPAHTSNPTDSPTYMSLVHTDSFRQTPICAHSTQRVEARFSRTDGQKVTLETDQVTE